jgi:hypothetical protein
MVAVDLLLKATEWGVQVVQAAHTMAQKRTADVVEKSAVLVAGLQHMDARFTELFVPLVFYDAGSWPIERRRNWAEDTLGFIYGDRVVDRIGQAITYLENTRIDDRQLAALAQDLCDITHVALWGGLQSDVAGSGVSGDASESGLPDAQLTWADGSRHRVGSSRVIAARLSLRERLDPDDLVAPAVSALVNLMRTEEPDPQQVARAASACLVVPREIGPRDYNPPMPPAETMISDPFRRDREDFYTLEQLDRDSAKAAEAGREYEAWPEPLNTVSPLRDFADNAGRRFQQILAVARTSFPGLPEPAWLWSPPT